MIRPNADDLLDILACDIEARPGDAPGIEIGQYARAIKRTDGEVVIDFDPAAVASVEASAAAERVCCSSITWRVEQAPSLRLRIGASSEQLDVIEKMFAAG